MRILLTILYVHIPDFYDAEMLTLHRHIYNRYITVQTAFDLSLALSYFIYIHM